MTDRPATPARPCAVPGCAGTCTDPGHVVNAAPAAALPYPLPLCPEHWRAVEQGAEWVATERSGDRTTRGVQLLLGDELVRRRLLVAEGAGVEWRRAGFSAPLAPDRNLGVLGVEGRVYGSAERVSVELVLTPAVVTRLRSVLGLYPEAADPR
jgi:hypothetical protein